MKTYQRAVDLMEAELGDDIVALDVARGTCFGFNSVASSVWRALAEPSRASGGTGVSENKPRVSERDNPREQRKTIFTQRLRASIFRE